MNAPGNGDEAVGKEPVRLSVSSLICFEQCSARYWRQYVLGEAPPVTPAMRRGTSVHRLIEKHFKTPLLTRDILGTRERMLFERFLASRFNKPPLSTERKISLSLPGALVAGRIDYVGVTRTGLEIVDFKTGAVTPRSDLTRDLQLPLYALALCRADGFPSELVTYTWYYVAADQEESFAFSDEQAEAVAARVDRLIEGIRGERWLDARCGTCWACRHRGSPPTAPSSSRPTRSSPRGLPGDHVGCLTGSIS